MPSWKAWVKRPSGLIKMEGSASAFIDSREVGIEANINKQSLIIVVYKYVFSNIAKLLKQ